MKKIKKTIFIFGLLFFLSINIITVFADDPIVKTPWIPDFPAQGKLEKCTHYYGGGWFTGSVRWVCHTQWVCPECTCTPEACGEVSVGH